MKRKFYLVPKDSQLREEFSRQLVVICSVKTKDGKVFDVIDYNYSTRSDIRDLLSHCEVVELDVVDENMLD